MKALFVGLGSIGQRHLRNLRTIVGESLEASAWRVTKTVPLLDGKGNAELGIDLAHHYQILEFERLRDALENKPNIVFVCNPNSFHVEVAQAAIDAGCDVFIEKPVSHSAAGIARLIQSVNATSRIVAVGFQYRFHPGFQQAKLWLNENRIGQFASASFINGEYIPGWHPYEDYSASYGARSDLGGGALVSQIHEIDMAYDMFGLPERVYAVGDRHSRLELDVEDSVTLLLRTMINGRNVPIDIHLDYLQSPPVRKFTIVGDKGRIVWDEQAQSVTLEEIDGGDVHEFNYPDFDRNDMFMDEMRDFLSAVEKRGRPLVDIETGSESLRIALAAQLSMKSGDAYRPVDWQESN